MVVARASEKELLARGRPPEAVRISPIRYDSQLPLRGPHVKKESGAILRSWPEAGLNVKRVLLVVCTVQGQADLRFGDYILHCPEGHFVLQPPGVPAYDGSHPHLEGTRRDHETCQLLSFAPWNEYTIRCWMCESRGDSHRTLVNYYVHSRQAVMHLRAINEEGLAQRGDFETICRALLVALFSIIRRELREGNFVQWIEPENRLPENLRADDAIAGAQKYMRANLSESLTIEQVAHEVFLSRSLFAKKFHEETGKTFIEYLTECRLAQAQILLRETDWPIMGVGRAVGLKPARLLEIFRAHLGVSPSGYREAHFKDKKMDDSEPG